MGDLTMQGYSGVTMSLATALVSKDNPAVPGMQLRLSQYQVRSNVPMFALHGIVSRPLPGAQVVLMHGGGGDPSNAVGVAVNDPRYHRAGLPDGTVGIAHHLGAHVLAFADRIEVDGGGKLVVVANASAVSIKAAASVRLNAPDVFTAGNLHVGTGASGSFPTPTGQIVTVKDGIVVNIF